MPLPYQRRNVWNSLPVATAGAALENSTSVAGSTSFVDYSSFGGAAPTLDAAKNRLYVLCVQNASAVTLEAATIGSIQARVLVNISASGVMAAICSAFVPDSNVTRFNGVPPYLPTTFRFSSAPGSLRSGGACVSGIGSATPVDIQSASDTIQTALSVNLKTELGGYYFAVAVNNITAAQSVTWSGTETPAELIDRAATSCYYSFAQKVGTAYSESSTITSTFAAPSTTGIVLAAASFK